MTKDFARRWIAVLACFTLLAGSAASEEIKAFSVPPRETDPSLSRFLSSNLVMTRLSDEADRGLLVFIPGTALREQPGGGKPFPFMRLYLENAVNLGYKVIALQYDNVPAVMQVCVKNSDSSCTDKVRNKRIFGDNVSDLIDDTPAESISSRLAHLLTYLAHRQPAQGWGNYLIDGVPRWDRITISGHSQGAGMAAYIAKKQPVARVVLLSGPIDYLSDGKTLSPWISAESATPPDLWFGVYHQREKGARLLSESYATLKIPSSHIRVLNGEPVPLPGHSLPDPFHVSVIVDKVTPRDRRGRPLYTPDWRFVLGEQP